MNREEAIEELKAIKSEYSDKHFDTARLMRSEHEALDMAIKALEQEPNCPFYKIDDDGHGLCMNHSEQKYCQNCKHNDDFDNDICLECEYDGHTRGMTRYELQEPSGDLISREAVIELTWEEPSYTDALNVLTEIRDKVKMLPPVNPKEPKTGHWIPTYGNVKCSVCGSVKDSRDVGKATHYCDFCGAKMVEPQESKE